MVDIILFGVAYVVMVYCMVVLMKKRTGPINGEDDDDGGSTVLNLPDLDDLPPGISLPGGGPARKKKTEEPDEVLV
ncbi:hypothetical protein [Nafulsella turpanensis]|uniref:hypothetical protein n=1 Tax=Nafulsella turpanensis TaxID=1265690 RepID=UPI00058ECB99|nr:hypothetical protein [Nafulsella turpanensis]